MRKAFLGTFVATLLVSTSALASNVTEFPDNGSEQLGRGGAWVARASDPLATQYNPAGLAGQPTRLTLQVSLPFAQTCFHRLRDSTDGTADTVLLESDGLHYPKVCDDTGTFPVPNLGLTIRAHKRLGIGFLLNAPSGAAAQAWPEFVTAQSGATYPAPERYLATYTNAFFITPTLGVGWEPVDNLRIGASFIAGIANATFSNGSLANNSAQDPRLNDIKATLSTSTAFVPGGTIGVLWSASPMIDLAGWYKVSAPIDASADVKTFANYYNLGQKVTTGDSSLPDCGSGVAPGTCKPGLGHVKLPVPMEAKIGVRIHKPRRGLAIEGAELHRRDPLAQDIWDLELNVTWANDSAIDTLQIRFPGTADGTNGIIPVAGTPGTVPPNADIPHNYNDVIGVRLGGDWNAVPNRLALRAGAFFESAAAPNKNGQNTTMATDFMSGNRVGLALGATLRVPLKKDAPPTEGGAIELSLGYMHMFVTDLNNDGSQGGIPALAGTACADAKPPVNNACTGGATPFRTTWFANLGTISNSLDVINIGASYRF
jgi:long-chain fatty acid transport protein